MDLTAVGTADLPLPIDGAKADDTRRRRIAKSVEMLREGRAR